MKVTHRIDKKFLVFPVNTYLPKKELLFFADGKQIFDLDIALDNVSPTFYANVNVERFADKEITLEAVPDMDVRFIESDEPMYFPEDASLRPKLHFAASSGWTNDPNGLYKYKDEYHLFYQHNPCDTVWANMHWGHAKSRDLVHWEELDEAIYPDERGTAFSGSAFVDRENASGLRTGEDAPILIYYTAAPPINKAKRSVSSGKPWIQIIRVSTDGGESFTDRPEVIGEICPQNRDPRVEYSPELGTYVMALYLDGNEFAILASDDLLNWKQIQRIHLDGDRECPNFARYRVAGTEEYKWVFYGANGIYSIYEIEDGAFRPIRTARSHAFSTAAYAGQDFPDPDTDRRLKLDWIRCADMLPPANFSQLIGIPVELVLIKDVSGYYLTERPAQELLSLAGEEHTVTGASAVSVSDGPLLVRLKAPYKRGTTVFLTVQGRRIELDMKNNKIASRKFSAPLSHDESAVDVTVVADRLTLDIFADEGRYYLTSVELSDPNIPTVELTGNVHESSVLTLSKINV